MKTNNTSGRNLAMVVGVWIIIKTVLNMLIDGLSFSQLGGDFVNIIIAVVEVVLLLLGIKYTNYAIAAILAIVAIVHLPGNIQGLFNFSSMLACLIYIAEAAIDVICAIVVCLAPSVKEHFTNDISDISGGK